MGLVVLMVGGVGLMEKRAREQISRGWRYVPVIGGAMPGGFPEKAEKRAVWGTVVIFFSVQKIPSI